MSARRLQGAALAAVALLVLVAPAGALPRFAARTGAPCSLCHVNPAGGGMRTDYGREIYTQFKLPILLPDAHGAWPFGAVAPRISDSLAIGADLRTIYIHTFPDRPNGDGVAVPEQSTFFQMQADLYVTAHLGKYVTAYVEKGMTGGFEAWLMATVPQWLGLSLRVGRYMPTFGLRFANHTAITREKIGFGPLDKDIGVELALRPGPVSIRFGVFNGELGSELFDSNLAKQLVATVDYTLQTRLLNLLLGLSWSDNKTDIPRGAGEDPAEGRESRYGAFGAVSFGRFTWLGEVVLVREEDSVADVDLWKLVSYQELSFLPVRGVDLQAFVELEEPDLELETGLYSRFGAGFEVFPIPNLEFKMIYRHTIAEGSPTDGMDELLFFAHGFF